MRRVSIAMLAFQSAMKSIRLSNLAVFLVMVLVFWALSIHRVLAADAAASSQSLRKPNATSLHNLIEGVYYLIDQNQPEHAIPHLRKAIQHNPDHPDAYYFLGVSYYRLSSIVQAIFFLNEAEKRGVQHDSFRPDIILQIEKEYPAQLAEWNQDSEQFVPRSYDAQIVVESQERGTIFVRPLDGVTGEFKPGESISLTGGNQYTLRFATKSNRELVKRLTLTFSLVAIWLIR